MKKSKLIKNKCEIDSCNITDSNILHLHHIIERTELKTSNDNLNLCILCPNHHSYVHSGRLKIIGIFPSTKLPNKRTVIYELDGKRNIEGIDDPYVDIKPKSFKIFGVNDEEKL